MDGNKDLRQILLVDDDEVDRMRIARMLRPAADRFELTACQSLDEARGLLAERSFDCILLDYRLGGHSGFDLLAELDPVGVGVVMMTGHAQVGLAVEAMQQGADNFLTKGEFNAEALERAIVQAIHSAQKAESHEEQRRELEAFVGRVAHDLRGRLNTIQLANQLAGRKLDKGIAPTAEHENIEQQVEQTSEFLDRLLAYTRTGRSRLQAERVPLSGVLDRVCNALAGPILKAGAEITWDSLPTLWADETAIEQLFQNLIGNALKFSGDRRPRVRVYGVEQADRFAVCVADEGIGIAPEDRERIFNPFEQVGSRPSSSGTDDDAMGDAEAGGIGLGLSVCRKLVEQHRGQIVVTDNQPRGTVFELHFPSKAVAEPGGSGGGQASAGQKAATQTQDADRSNASRVAR